MAAHHFTIRSDAEHRAALLQLEQLWNASLGQPQSEELRILIKAVVDYENRRWLDEPVPASPLD